MMQGKNLETQEQTKAKSTGQQEIIKISTEINEIETKQRLQRVNESKS